MNQQQKQQIARIYGTIAEVFGKNLSDNGLRLMVESLEDLPFDLVMHILQNWTSTGTQFPMPFLIRDKICPENSERDIGIEVAARIIQAISKFGNPNLLQAREFMGELGWKVVQRQGGWLTLCSELTEENKGITQAQLRDLAMTIARMSKNGSLDKPIGLPEPMRAIENGHEPVKKLIMGAFNK